MLQVRVTEDFGSGRFSEPRRKVWDLLEKPQTSKAARVSLQSVFRLVATGQLSPASPSGLLNRVPASAGVRAGMSPLPGGR